MKTIVIFGRGQVGTFYKDYFGSRGFNIVQPTVDIRDYEGVKKAVAEAGPEFVISTAGKTNIDWCEQNKLEAFDVNVLGADNIARVCQEQNVYLVHISSGCIQESKTADEVHQEEDLPNPTGYYGWTKVWAENLIMDRANRQGLKVLVLRPRQLVSAMVSPRNALTKMLTYSKFIDTANSCTVVEDLMYVTEELVKKGRTGVYNVANPGVTSPYRIALKLKELIKPGMAVEKISKEELNKMTLAIRIDTVLDTRKLQAEGIEPAPIEDRLVDIIKHLKHNLERQDAAEVLAKTEAETRVKLNLE